MTEAAGWLHQTAYDVRLAWGPRAAFEAAARRDVVVLVDVLSFSTAVCAAVSHGAAIVPFAMGDPEAAAAEAKRLGVRISVGDGATQWTKRALSPLRFTPAVAGEAFLLCSPNGATCSRIAADSPVVLLGCLRNASAVAAHARACATAHRAAITIVPCGEIWAEAETSPAQRLRPAVEDHLGAGAIAAGLIEGGANASPEAWLAARMFDAARPDLAVTLQDCASGRELHERGYGADVDFASALDAVQAVPVLRDGRFVCAE